MPFEAFARFLNGESSLDDLRSDLTREIQDNAAAAWYSRTNWDNSFDPQSNENYHRVSDGQLHDRALGREGNSAIDAFTAYLSSNRNVLDHQNRLDEINHVRNEYIARNTFDPVDDQIRHDIATGQDPRYNSPYPNDNVASANTVDHPYETLRNFNDYNLNNYLW